MKFKDIIEVADLAYPDGMIQQAFDAYKKNHPQDEPLNTGDGLAEFIVLELIDTYDKKAESLVQLHEAFRVIKRAEAELFLVAKAFELLIDLRTKKGKSSKATTPKSRHPNSRKT